MAGIKGRINIDGLKKLQESINKMNETQRREWNEQSVKELASRLLILAIKETPFGDYPSRTGKKGGTLKRGWTIGEVKKEGDTYTIEIINPVEYAPYVEYGHRTKNHKGWVEGKFMLTNAELATQENGYHYLQEKLNKFMEGAFK